MLHVLCVCVVKGREIMTQTKRETGFCCFICICNKCHIVTSLQWPHKNFAHFEDDDTSLSPEFRLAEDLNPGGKSLFNSCCDKIIIKIMNHVAH